MVVQQADCWLEPSVEPWLGGWISVDGGFRIKSLVLRADEVRVVLSAEDVPTAMLMVAFEDSEI